MATPGSSAPCGELPGAEAPTGLSPSVFPRSAIRGAHELACRYPCVLAEAILPRRRYCAAIASAIAFCASASASAAVAWPWMA